MNQIQLDQELNTKQRLLDAAGEIFSQFGYKQTTIRDICQKAGANVASINYYFRDKQELYTSVLRYEAKQALEEYPPDFGVGENAGAEERLRAFIRGMLYRFMSTGRMSRYVKLMAREMVDPTPALDDVVREVIQPMVERLEGIVSELLGQLRQVDTVRLCAMSIAGQCLLYKHEREVLSRLYGKNTYAPNELNQIAEHITRFSLNAIAGIKGK